MVDFLGNINYLRGKKTSAGCSSGVLCNGIDLPEAVVLNDKGY
jgi:hypothetical protein